MSGLSERLNYIKNRINILRNRAISFISKKMAFRKINNELQIIAESQYFDKEWYLQQYPDVALSKLDPMTHYLLHGGFEGRDPGYSFSSTLYMKNHPELATNRINPLIHYLHQEKGERSKTRLFLHVGLHKTGTSAIQRFLRRNSSLLEEKGIYYPKDSLGGDAQHAFPLVLRRKDPLGDIDYAQKWIADCGRYCKAHNLSLLISSEIFSESIRNEELAKLLKPFDTSLIIYIRRQDLLIESVINQIFKQALQIHPDDVWMKRDNKYIVDFTRRVRQWRETIPNCNIIVRRYDSRSLSGPLEIDFINTLGIREIGQTCFEPVIVNESLKLYEFIILRKLTLNGIITSPSALEQARIKLSELMVENQILDFPMVGNYFDQGSRRYILEMYSDANEQIRSEFFPDDDYLFEPMVNKSKVKINADIISALETEMMKRLSGT